MATEREAGGSAPTATPTSRWAIRSWSARRAGRSTTGRAGGCRDGCGSYNCVPPPRRRAGDDGSEPVLLITAAELDCGAAGAGGAAPPPGVGSDAVGAGGASAAAGVERARSRLAIASFVCAIAGIPLFGLVTGWSPSCWPCMALGRDPATRGAGSGWRCRACCWASWTSPAGRISSVVPSGRAWSPTCFSDPPPDFDAIKELDPPLQRAMRANVLIERQTGLALLGGMAIGSGVILRIERGECADRHQSSRGGPRVPPRQRRRPAVAGVDRLRSGCSDQPDSRGKVVIWMAPGQIDLALVRARCPFVGWPGPPPGSGGGPCGSGRRSSPSATRITSAGRTPRA